VLSLYISALVLHCQCSYDLDFDLSTQNPFRFNKMIIVEIIDVVVMVSDARIVEVFTLLHEFLQILPDSEQKVGIPQNSMEFLWKAIGWSLEVFTLLHEFLQILSRKSEFCGIPWNFYGKQLAGASAILVSNSMEIPTFFQGIPMEMVGTPEPLGMIPMGITIIYIVKNSYNIKN